MINENYEPISDRRAGTRRAYDRKREQLHARFKRLFAFTVILVFAAGVYVGIRVTSESARAKFDSVNCVERVK